MCMTQLMIKTVYKNVALSLIFFLFIFNSTFGQKINLTGKVVDSKNKQGLEDVYVQIKGSSLSTATNTLGEFSFSKQLISISSAIFLEQITTEAAVLAR